MTQQALFSGGQSTAKQPPNTFDLYAMFLGETQGAPSGWRVGTLSTLDSDAPPGFAKVHGAVHPVNRDGYGTWDKRDRSTERTYFVKMSDVDDFRKAKATAEGVCYECWGQGSVCTGFSAATGKKYKPCPVCGGSTNP